MLTSSEEPPKNPLQSKLDHALNEIANHMFVTEETKIRREKLRSVLPSIKSSLGSMGVHDIVAFPFGSVAVGMAGANSDIDTYLLYSGDTNPNIPHRINLRDYDSSIPPSSDAAVIGADSLINDEYIRGFSEYVLENKDPNRFWVLTDSFPRFFFPSLNEFVDPKEKTIVNSWRRKTLETIIRLYPDKSEEIWNLMRQYLRSRLVDYDKLVTQDVTFDESNNLQEKDNPKRESRVEGVISTTIKERFPTSETKQQRALSFIDVKRSAFEYPDFKTVTSDLGIKTQTIK